MERDSFEEMKETHEAKESKRLTADEPLPLENCAPDGDSQETKPQAERVKQAWSLLAA